MAKIMSVMFILFSLLSIVESKAACDLEVNLYKIKKTKFFTSKNGIFRSNHKIDGLDEEVVAKCRNRGYSDCALDQQIHIRGDVYKMTAKGVLYSKKPMKREEYDSLKCIKVRACLDRGDKSENLLDIERRYCSNL